MSIMPALRRANDVYANVSQFEIVREILEEVDPSEPAAMFTSVLLDPRLGELSEDELGAIRSAIEGVAMVIESWPASHHAALYAGVRSAVFRDVAVQFAWLPSYDNELTISEFQELGSLSGRPVM